MVVEFRIKKTFEDKAPKTVEPVKSLESLAESFAAAVKKSKQLVDAGSKLFGHTKIDCKTSKMLQKLIWVVRKLHPSHLCSFAFQRVSGHFSE